MWQDTVCLTETKGCFDFLSVDPKGGRQIGFKRTILVILSRFRHVDSLSVDLHTTWRGANIGNLNTGMGRPLEKKKRKRERKKRKKKEKKKKKKGKKFFNRIDTRTERYNHHNARIIRIWVKQYNHSMLDKSRSMSTNGCILQVAPKSDRIFRNRRNRSYLSDRCKNAQKAYVKNVSLA